jgi:hypothetical protein
MAKFIRALAKMGLVQLEDGDLPAAPPSASEPTDLDALLAEARALSGQIDATGPGAGSEPAAAPVPEPEPALPPIPVEGITDDRPLPAIYAEAGIPASPFPAEKLLRMLDGLAAMEPAVRRAAVIAMDNADDTWTVHDALLDAGRKAEALEAARRRLDQALAAAEQQATADLQAQDTFATQATEAIQAQIAELEATLAAELQQVGEQKAQIRARLEAARAARAHQVARFEGEIERLRSLYPAMGEPRPGAPSS